MEGLLCVNYAAFHKGLHKECIPRHVMMMTSKMLLTTNVINDHDDMMTVIMMMTMTVMMIAIPCLLGWSA